MTNSPLTQDNIQHALIGWLARECGGGGAFGKTALQKLVYILTCDRHVRTGYDFTLYTYGPYSKDLQGDLDVSDFLGIVSIRYIEEHNRYIVSESTNTEKYVDRAREFINNNIEHLNWVASNLGTKSARYLELFSTLHYIIDREGVQSDEVATVRLMEIKPKFSKSEVLSCLHEVQNLCTLGDTVSYNS